MTIKEWKLVFFGTETSLEVDDELDKDRPDLSNVAEGESENKASTDAKQNSVDHDGESSWNQQVDRVSHPEAQKPATENRTTIVYPNGMDESSGCVRYDESRACLGACLIFLLFSQRRVLAWVL